MKEEIKNKIDLLNDLQLMDLNEYIDKLVNRKVKRSINANNYLWQIIQQIADKLGSTKEDIYKHAILDKGQFQIIPVKNEVVEQFIKCWNKNGLGNICEVKGKSKIEGYTNVICYFGSSSYDNIQFHAFTEYIVEEAKELGIDTRTPDEIMMLERI